MITIKKKREKEKEEKDFKYFGKCNVKKYYNKEKIQHFSFNVFENFRIIKNMFQHIKNLKKRYS